MVVGRWRMWLNLGDHRQQRQLTLLTTYDLIQLDKQFLHRAKDLVLSVQNHLQLSLFRLIKLTTSQTGTEIFYVHI